jgi:hypothetical protein
MTMRWWMGMTDGSRVARGRFLAVALVCVGLVLQERTAWAWGRMGHRAAARLTESRLTPAARAAVRGLLAPGESLADASTWADEHRRDFPMSGSWHYVNVPITEPHFLARYCPDTGCVVTKIGDFRRILADPKSPRVERQQALRFLTHFVQDLHQPVHVGDRGDRGGNDLQVQFFDQGSNLHRVWDSGMIERYYHDESALYVDLGALARDEATDEWSGDSVEGWADESLAAARRAYLLPGTDLPLRRGSKLGTAYQDENLPVARRRLAQSAVRLANVLNATLTSAP